jgi:hypothetical protein
MADRVDAAVHAMQPTGPDPVRDRVRIDPEVVELSARDHAVLTVASAAMSVAELGEARFSELFTVSRITPPH